MKEFKCSDAGHACEWKARSNDENEIVRSAKEHGQKMHGLEDVKDDQIRPLIHEIA